jgi:hypothetical protein
MSWSWHWYCPRCGALYSEARTCGDSCRDPVTKSVTRCRKLPDAALAANQLGGRSAVIGVLMDMQLIDKTAADRWMLVLALSER